MRWVRLVTAAAVLVASAASAQDLAEAARRAMLEALREHAPSPTHPPMLPDRAMPGEGIPHTQAAATKSAADRAARAHAAKDGAQHGDRMRTDAANGAAMGAMMDASMNGCDAQRPADMMKSRGMMPGGEMMGPGGGTTGSPGGGQMPGSGMHPLTTGGLDAPAAAGGSRP